jgi:hypothetical protein
MSYTCVDFPFRDFLSVMIKLEKNRMDSTEDLAVWVRHLKTNHSET